MMSRPRPNRLSAASAVLLAGLVALPLAVAFAADPGNGSQPAPEGRPSSPANRATLRGRVTDEKGAPLADVRVRVAVPAADMRFVDTSTDHKQREARTDAKGEYRLEIPWITKRMKISIDAMKPGYRRLAGTLMQGGDPKDVEVEPGAEVEASLVLKPALYVAGVVVDEQGKPIPAVKINAIAGFAFSSGGVEITASRPDGSFELFNYQPRAGDLRTSKGLVFLSHPDYIATNIPDIYAIAAKEREALRIVLRAGCKVTGTVLDVVGKPVPHAMVQAALHDGNHRKATLTDADGRFTLRGLNEGLTLLSVRALDIKQKAQLPMALKGDKIDLEVRLKPIPMPADLPRYSVLGMQLTDMTPELKSAYDQYHDRGALILDPGQDSNRLAIGKIVEGDIFWMVGQKRIGSVREFVDQILAETAGQNAAEYRVRVVYMFIRVDAVGNMTQYLRLTKEHLKQLKTISDQLAPDTP